MQAEKPNSTYTMEGDQVRLEIYEHGPSYLVCLPGLGLTGDSFLPSMPDKYSWILVDYIDYGSPKKYKNCGLNEIAAEISRLLKKEDITSGLNIISHSMGGVVAAFCTEELDFSGWLNLEGNLDPDDCFFSRRICRYDHDNFLQGGATDYLRLLRRSAGVIESNSILQYLEQIEKINHSALWHHACDTVKYTDNFFARDRFLAFNAPKIYIVGEETRWTPTLNAAVESGELNTYVIKDAGHFMIHENSDEVSKCILDFIK